MKVVVFIYIFIFASLFKLQASQKHLFIQQHPKDCVKHPQILKPQSAEKNKASAEKIVKNGSSAKSSASIPHFSVLNFINFFYTKDTLDNLHVM